jgi:(2R)-sulfolactate sulfo-lyase subunit alpha
MTHGFLVHKEGDYVGVAVRDLDSDEEVTGMMMDTNRVVTVRAIEPIPLGHKVALQDVESGTQVIEYGFPIGKATQPIRVGNLVHIQNIRSARW